MTINIFLRERKGAVLLIGGMPKRIGIISMLCNIKQRGHPWIEAQITGHEQRMRGTRGPAAVMTELGHYAFLASQPTRRIEAHVVLGWDADRIRTDDYFWGYLPVLGYAVKREDCYAHREFVLHEEKDDGLLYPTSAERAMELGILRNNGTLIRRGQRAIKECQFVEDSKLDFAKAHCVLSDGTPAKVLTGIKRGVLPEPAWYFGKMPDDVTRYYASA